MATSGARSDPPNRGPFDDAQLDRTLLEVLRATASQRDVQTLLGSLIEVLHQATRFDRVALVLHDPARDVMHLHGIAALHPTSPSVTELPVADSPAGIAWREQAPVLVPDMERESRFPIVRDILQSEGMRSFCVVPLTSPLRKLGALVFASSEPNDFREADVDLLQQVASHVALSVDNVLHHAAAEQARVELERERDRLRLLLEVNNALVSNLETPSLFRAIAQCLRRVVAHDYTSLAVFDPAHQAFDMWAIEFAGKGLIKEHMLIPLVGSPPGIAFAAGKPVCFARADLERLPAESGDLLLGEGLQSMCTVPLTVHERKLGTISAGRLGTEPFSADDAELLATVARQIAFAVENALAFQEIATLKDRLAAEKVYLEDEIRTSYDFEEIIGDSSVLKRVLHQVETVAPTESAVLIRGETGTGKELIARALHDLSARRARTFVKLNCAAIPTGLLESELFGHERGAFTGAIAQRIGRFELADGGTLFLDEVGDIPLELQPKLLRVLQEREFERLGGSRTKRVDVRVVAATNRDLEAMVAAGTFRNDLYYRLNVFPLTLPPLRERPEDVPPLVRYFAQKFARSMKKRIETIPTDVMAALQAYDWPGNIRELENAVERAVILATGPELRIPVVEFGRRTPPASAPLGTPPTAAPTATLAATERDAIVRTLQDTRWVLGGPHGAAARLGMKRTTLQSRMEKLGIRRPG